MDGSSADRARAALGNCEHRDGLRAGGALSPLNSTAEQARGVPLGSGDPAEGPSHLAPLQLLHRKAWAKEPVSQTVRGQGTEAQRPCLIEWRKPGLREVAGYSSKDTRPPGGRAAEKLSVRSSVSFFY